MNTIINLSRYLLGAVLLLLTACFTMGAIAAPFQLYRIVSGTGFLSPTGFLIVMSVFIAQITLPFVFWYLSKKVYPGEVRIWQRRRTAIPKRAGSINNRQTP